MKLARGILVAVVLITAPLSAQNVRPGVDAQHQVLAGLMGRWTVRQTFWTSPKAAPKTDRGSANFAMVLNGRHLRQRLQIEDGTGFEGLGYIGYDNASGQFFSTWMDVNFPGIVIARGGFEPASKAYIFRGSMSASASNPEIPVREVLTILDKNHLKYEFFETRGGVETLAVRLEYSRLN